jgi:hypothetical protein
MERELWPKCTGQQPQANSQREEGRQRTSERRSEAGEPTDQPSLQLLSQMAVVGDSPGSSSANSTFLSPRFIVEQDEF